MIPVHISNTKFISNYESAVTLFVGGRRTYTCNSSTYTILVDRCEFSINSARFAHTALMAAMMSEVHNRRVNVHKNVLKVRIVIQNSTFHHNFKLQDFSQQNGDLIQFYQLPEIHIINSTFYSNSDARTMLLSKSKVTFCGQVVFENNTSTTDGGALHLDDSSLLHFEPNTRVLFTNNRASQRGGAIYVDNTKRDDYYSFCFYEFGFEDVRKNSQANVQLVFEGNLAAIAGDALYGGRVDRGGWLPKVWPKEPHLLDGVDFKKTYIRKLLLTSSGSDFELIFNFTDKAPSLSLISSDPFRIYFCDNEREPEFALEQSIYREAYPGQIKYSM